jgi:hypothetical protein
MVLAPPGAKGRLPRVVVSTRCDGRRVLFGRESSGAMLMARFLEQVTSATLSAGRLCPHDSAEFP